MRDREIEEIIAVSRQLCRQSREVMERARRVVEEVNAIRDEVAQNIYLFQKERNLKQKRYNLHH